MKRLKMLKRCKQDEHNTNRIVSAEKAIFSGEATMLIAPGKDGDLGIAPKHTPLLTTLRPGEIEVHKNDNEKDIEYIANKIVNLRIFQDNKGKFDKSLLDIDGELLIVSQFTLYGDCRKGRRPSFDQAETVEKSKIIYNDFIKYLKNNFSSIILKQGIFQAHMEVTLTNDGPVTFILDSKKSF